jgi:hypothetical protein
MNTRISKLSSLKKIVGVGAIAATFALSAGTLAPQSASAATGISGCFAYKGVAYRNVSTQLEYMTTTGDWAALDDSISVTNSRGCYHYSVWGSWTRLNIRVVAAAAVPGWRGFFWGYSPYYAQTGNASYSIGTGALSFLSLAGLPAAPRSSSLTSSWLDGMTSGGECDTSSAMLVACYMDQHGMVGNTVVQYRDFDGDGYRDNIDLWPNDSSHH